MSLLSSKQAYDKLPQTYGALIASLSAWFCFYILLLYFKKVKHAILLVKRLCIYFSCSGLLKAFCLAELKRNVKLLLGGSTRNGGWGRRGGTRSRREKAELSADISFPYWQSLRLGDPSVAYAPAPLKGAPRARIVCFSGDFGIAAKRCLVT